MTQPMTDAMRSFLGGLSAADKRAIATIAQEGGTSLTARLVRAVYVELLAAKVREDELFAGLEADARDDVDRLTESWVKVWPPEVRPSGGGRQ